MTAMVTMYCAACQFRQPHANGVCVACRPLDERPKPVEPDPLTLDMFATPKQAPAQARPTSEAAAVEISKVLSAKRRAVFVHICQTMEGGRRGVSHNEMIRHFAGVGWSMNTPRARAVELARAGLIEETGESDGSTLWGPTRLGWNLYLDIAREDEA
jgi:hypothetical protein